ncbi:MAG: T9SS C-terminal target domain-containing protein [Winogradskyella sp.]|uniref:T9SS type A sorting domain-containing protein n=1 Tax=Winogradskyella sp. TaxID=1883156 RepID=UPI000F3BDF3D|nr:T9SS type A sorting domain-containing protein [Winogradskyella sp.]RNC86856.1 MAG: T9SS C-terminal target domain-containing protein [Winogradskyella sp.]
MKKITSLVIIILFTCISKLTAQATTVTNTAGTPISILIEGNELFIVESSTDNITKIDITDTNPTPVVVSTVCNIPAGLSIRSNELFISCTGGSIQKIDLSAPFPPSTITDVVSSGLGNVTESVLMGNDLYFIQLNGKISKVDVTLVTPVVIDLITGLPSNGLGIIIDGDDLYFSTFSGEINKLDLSAVDPSSTLTTIISSLNFPAGMAIKEDYLYFAEAGNGKISRINISQINPTPQEIVSGLMQPRDILINDNDLFISDFNSNEILKFDLNTLSINENEINNRIVLHPNPSGNLLQISGLTKIESYKVYDSLGKEVMNGTLYPNKKVDIQNLTKGLYFLKIEDRDIVKFIKQ